MRVFGLNLKRFISIGGFVYNRQLDSFVRVVDAGSFNKAARDLYIIPASLIQQVNLLEERLGVQLLTRSRRGGVAHRGGVVSLPGCGRDHEACRLGG